MPVALHLSTHSPQRIIGTRRAGEVVASLLMELCTPAHVGMRTAVRLPTALKGACPVGATEMMRSRRPRMVTVDQPG